MSHFEIVQVTFSMCFHPKYIMKWETCLDDGLVLVAHEFKSECGSCCLDIGFRHTSPGPDFGLGIWAANTGLFSPVLFDTNGVQLVDRIHSPHAHMLTETVAFHKVEDSEAASPNFASHSLYFRHYWLQDPILIPFLTPKNPKQRGSPSNSRPTCWQGLLPHTRSIIPRP